MDDRDDNPAAPADEPFARFRADFPVFERWTYLNTCSIGVMSRTSCDAANRVNEQVCGGDFAKEDAFPVLRRTRARFARLIGAKAHEVAVVKNVSEGLNAVACAVAPASGDNVVVCLELEHPNNVYLWLRLARLGVEVRDVAPRGLEIDTDAMAAAIDGRTRIVTASSVTFTPGFRADLRRLGGAARRHGALFLVDAVQSCGVIDHDVEEEFIDALATSTTKNLLGAAGLGFLYVRDAWLDRLEPVYVSRYSVARGDGHESEIEHHDCVFAPTGERFEIGNYNWPGVAAADIALAQLGAVGIARIEARAVEFADALREGIAALGLPVNEPRDRALRTHMVTVGRRGAGGAYASDDAALNAVAQTLQQTGVRFSIRRGLIRFGLHGFNQTSDVETVLGATRCALDAYRRIGAA